MSELPINPYESPRELCELPPERWHGNDWFVRLLWAFLAVYSGMTLLCLALSWLTYRDGYLLGSAASLLLAVFTVWFAWSLIVKELREQRGGK